MAISQDEVKHVAMLARLNFAEDELEAFTRQLGNILTSIQKLEELDTTNVEPTAHVLPVNNVFREDVTKEGLEREAALQNAPEAEEGQFKVPKIV